MERKGRLHLKYKTAQYVVTGPVMVICRRCAEINETVCPHLVVLQPAEGRAVSRVTRSRTCTLAWLAP